LKNRSAPPKIPSLLLRGLSHPYHRANALGDLEELYAQKLEKSGMRQANRWYRYQALKSVPHLIHSWIYWSATMFKSYLKMTWRNILRHKGYSLINITGLAVGMACCILIIMYVTEELSFDGFHEKGSRIFRANTISSLGSNTRSFPVVPAVFIACLGLFGLSSFTTTQRTKEIGWDIFLLSALITIVITLVTISYQSIKSALANPTDSLRYE